MFYKQHIFCCTNERKAGHKNGCCSSKGSLKITNYVKARVKELGIKDIRVNKSGCLNRCDLGPVVVMYPEGNWYKIETKEDVDRFLQEKILNSSEIEELRVEDHE